MYRLEKANRDLTLRECPLIRNKCRGTALSRGLASSFPFFFKAQEAVLSNLSNVMYTDYSNNKKKDDNVDMQCRPSFQFSSHDQSGEHTTKQRCWELFPQPSCTESNKYCHNLGVKYIYTFLKWAAKRKYKKCTWTPRSNGEPGKASVIEKDNKNKQYTYNGFSMWLLDS